MAEGNSPKDIRKEVNPGGSSDEYSIFGANVPVSPPQSISVEDMLRMKAEVENMILTHEAALEENFRLEKSNAESNSLEGRVRAIVEKAFWDILEEQLNEDPPNYSQAMVLFQEIKQELLDLLPPTRHSIKDMIEEVLDVELIKQKLQHSVFDLGLYARFVVDIMAKLCAPVRDEDVAKLNTITEVVPLYREIFRVLELMKLDLANFTLSLIRPHLKQHSVEIERKKFLEILKIQQQNGIDGLQNTKLWLASSLFNLQAKQSITTSSQESAGTGQENVKEGGNITANDVLNESYLRLLIAGHDRRSIAETLLVDCHRLDELRNNFGLLVLVSSVLAISTSAAGQLDEEFKKKLRIQIFTLTQNVPPSEYKERSLALCDQVVKELNGWLSSKNAPLISESSEKLLRDQMMNIMDPNATSNPVCKLMGERLCLFLSQIISNPNLKNIDTPRGFASLAIELKQFGGQFANIISHNQAVFGSIYSDIIGDLMRKHSTTGDNTQESN